MKYLFLPFFFVLTTCFYSCEDKNANQHLLEAEDNIQKRDIYAAELSINKSLKLDSTNAKAYFIKGLILSKLNANEKALSSFSKSIQLNSEYEQAYLERAKIKNQFGDYYGAIEDCQIVKTDSNLFIEKHYQISISYKNLNQNKLAISNLRAAIEINNMAVDTMLFSLAQLYLNEKNNDSACYFLRKAAELGNMNSFELIKLNCNQVSNKATKNNEINKSLDNKILSEQINCNCKKINRPDAQVFQCLPLPVAYDKETQIALAMSKSSEEYYLTLTVRFKGKRKDIDRDLTLWLKNGDMISFPYMNGGSNFVEGEVIQNAIYSISKDNLNKLNKSDINTIAFHFSDDVRRTYKATSYSNILRVYFDCLKTKKS